MAEHAGDPQRHLLGIGEQIEAVHPVVVPAETAQHRWAQAQRIAQAPLPLAEIEVDGDCATLVGGGERDHPVIVERHDEAERFEAIRKLADG